MARSKENLVSLGSGGSTFLNLGVGISRGFVPKLNLSGLIISEENEINVPNARRLGAPWRVVNQESFRGDDGKVDEYGFGQALNKAIAELGGTVVSQNGWLQKTPRNTIEQYSGVIYNQHPGPKRETRATHGKRSHAIMLELVRLTGRNEGTDVIIHRIDEKWDHGETVAISHVPIFEADTPESLQRAALYFEYILQLDHWRRVVEDKVTNVSEPVYMRPGEEHLLIEARDRAKEIYPNG
ncbi:MAG: hypothetical protein AAB521_00170 [Patescibacteria group bacterium]